MARKGQDLLAVLQKGGNKGSKTEKVVVDRIQSLSAAWKELNKKMGSRRKMLNDCSRYLQFSERVRRVENIFAKN